MPWLAFVFLMAHTAMNQLTRQFADNPSTVDITGAQMVLVMKLSAFAWNVADGTLPDDQLSDFQKDRRIIQLPGLLDYAAYVLFFPSLLVGPAFDYNEYRGWIDTSMFDVPASVDPTKKPPTRKRRKIPRSATPAMWKMAAGLVWLVLFLKFSAWYSPSVFSSDDYQSHGFLLRVFTVHMVGFTARFKYYAVWSLSEGACILAGLGYNGVDPVTGKVSWDRLQNINPWGVELAQNSRAYLGNWNMNTNKWLRFYIYLRVTPRNKKPGFRASMATFVTSAFWHGFYPGYYLAFVLGSFVQTAAKSMFFSPSPSRAWTLGNQTADLVDLDLRRYVRPFFLDPTSQQPLPSKKYYDFLSWFTTQVTFSFVAAPFVVLRLDESLAVWASVYFYAVIGTIFSMAFFASPAKGYLRQALEQRAKAAGGKLVRSISTDSLAGGRRPEPVLGIGDDPIKDWGEAVEELRAEVERVHAKQGAHGPKKGASEKSGEAKKEL